MEPVVTILLLGPTGSGKSTFIKHATGNPNVNTGAAGGAKPCTTECKDYNFRLNGANFILIDTPGFEDSPPGSLSSLKSIAEMLKDMPSLRITGAIYFHRITDGRLTGSARFNLAIFKQICGEEFFPHVAFVTTMWDTVGGRGRERYDKLNRELEERHMRLVEEGPDIFKFYSDLESCKTVLHYFARLASTSRPPPLLFRKQLGSNSSVRKTSAGKEAMRKSGRDRGGVCSFL